MKRVDQVLKSGVSIVCIVLTFFMIIVLVWTSSYSVLVADDFAVLDVIYGKQLNILQLLKAALTHSLDIYMNWQGTYFGSFLITAVNPIAYHGLQSLRWIMVVNSVLFFAALLILLTCVLKELKVLHNQSRNTIAAILIALVVFSICGYETYPEIFFWFTGAMMYSIPFSALLIGFALYIRLDDAKKSSIKALMASILGFLGCGGVLVISGTGCYIALLLLVYQWLKIKKLPKRKLFVFIVWLIGSILNVIAPGNFKRHSYIDDTGLHLIDAITNSLLMICGRYKTLFGYNFLLLLIIVILCGIVFGITHVDKVSVGMREILFSLFGLLTPIVASFPLALGTNSVSIPNRCAFIIDIGIIFSSYLFTFLIGEFVGSVLGYRLRVFVIVILLAGGIISCKYDGYSLRNFKTIELCNLHKDRVFENHYMAHVRFYDWVSTQKEEDVVVTPEHCPYGIDNVHNLYMSIDPNDWVNKLIARYCGVKSIYTDYD